LKTDPFIGVVLAGGASRRMGRDKALLTWRGKTMLEHMAQLLLAAGASRILVSGNCPEYAAHAELVPDAEPGGGPLVGLLSVLALHKSNALIVPVDMPLLSAPLLARLVPAALQLSACVHFADYMLPMWLHLDQNTLAQLQSLCALPGTASRGRSVRALQSLLKAQALPLSSAEQAELANCNTPEAWRFAATGAKH
jgi:molybdenum cofactor guanylyltransferase